MENHGVLDIPEEIKPFVGNYPMHLVEVADNQLSFENANNIDLFEMMKIFMISQIAENSGRRSMKSRIYTMR